MGIKKMEDEMRKTNKTFESKIELKPEEKEKEKKKPANHSNKVRGKFFETFGNKVADWLRDDVE
jgi:hypothetical protein